jgi:hypothetical protein
MTPKNKKILIGVSIGIAVVGTGYLLYRRNENKNNSMALLEYIDSLPKVNTSGSLTNVVNNVSNSIINEINSTSVSALNGKSLVFDGKAFVLGKDNAAITSKVTAIAKQLNDSMKGANIVSNVAEFMKGFSRIGNKNAMVYMNILYKSLYGETMWQAINGEQWLYLGNSKKLDILNITDIPNYNPVITAHLIKLK